MLSGNANGVLSVYMIYYGDQWSTTHGTTRKNIINTYVGSTQHTFGCSLNFNADLKSTVLRQHDR